MKASEIREMSVEELELSSQTSRKSYLTFVSSLLLISLKTHPELAP